jgi:hypothetical protein
MTLSLRSTYPDLYINEEGGNHIPNYDFVIRKGLIWSMVDASFLTTSNECGKRFCNCSYICRL